MPTLYWCPHQVFKATGAPALSKSTSIKVVNNGQNQMNVGKERPPIVVKLILFLR